LGDRLLEAQLGVRIALRGRLAQPDERLVAICVDAESVPVELADLGPCECIAELWTR
jgi:hypothetical protein